MHNIRYNVVYNSLNDVTCMGIPLYLDERLRVIKLKCTKTSCGRSLPNSGEVRRILPRSRKHICAMNMIRYDDVYYSAEVTDGIALYNFCASLVATIKLTAITACATAGTTVEPRALDRDS